MFYAPLVSFNPEQRQVAQGFTRAPSYAKAGPLARQALLEAGIVESTLRRDPSERNLDSRGSLQERASQGWGTVAEELNPTTAAEMFLRHAIPLEGRYHDAGQLAQAVQRSAFPGRYDEHSAQAASLLAQLGGSRQGHEALKAAGVNVQSPNIAALLQAITAPQSAPAAGIAIPRPVTSGGPEQASTGPRLPSPLTPAPAATPSALTAAIQQLGEQGITHEHDTEAPIKAASPQASQRLAGIVSEANHIGNAHVPYLWGGGHAGKVLPGGKVTPLDCSGAVSAALGVNPKVASEFETWGAPGKGKNVTIWASQGHVLLEVNGRFWGTSGSNPGGGAGWIKPGTISPEYLKGFVPRHPGNL